MQRKSDVLPDSKREGRSFGVITGGMGSSACTLFRDGSKVVTSGGVTTYTAADGAVTKQPGYGYVATATTHDDKTHVDVVVSGPKK